MKRNITILLLILSYVSASEAQKYITKEGVIDIFSETSLFTIEAKNQKVASILNTENGEIVASTLVRSFKFREALVEEHFNENYMESHLYPKAIFKGKITNFNQVDLSKNGTYNVNIKGSLTIHGETRELVSPGVLEVKDGMITGKTEFIVSLSNYKIKIEDQYKDRIKDEIKLNVNFNYKPMN